MFCKNRPPEVEKLSAGPEGLSVNSLYTSTLRWAGRSVKQFLPDETRHYRIRFGICRGNYLPMNLRRNVRVLFGLYEPEIAGYVRRYVRAGSCCYDIGAGYGYYTLALVRLSASGRIYAFEADDRRCTALGDTLAFNGLCAARVEIVNAFLTEHADQSEHCATLDQVVFERGFKPPDFIKMDVDGPEYEVLRGASRVLRRCRPRLIVETHSPELEINCKHLLEDAAYRVRIIKNYPFLKEHRPIELNRWLAAEPR